MNDEALLVRRPPPPRVLSIDFQTTDDPAALRMVIVALSHEGKRIEAAFFVEPAIVPMQAWALKAGMEPANIVRTLTRPAE